MAALELVLHAHRRLHGPAGPVRTARRTLPPAARARTTVAHVDRRLERARLLRRSVGAPCSPPQNDSDREHRQAADPVRTEALELVAARDVHRQRFAVAGPDEGAIGPSLGSSWPIHLGVTMVEVIREVDRHQTCRWPTADGTYFPLARPRCGGIASCSVADAPSLPPRSRYASAESARAGCGEMDAVRASSRRRSPGITEGQLNASM